ncbi:hypothetical protein [Pareuzebyella sediminis]|uniref:hypothetical protein n=1 Tax=Pareuzebyella sediminis TaxID=2607998 RepID=UPI0011EC10B9|nr:hypothetical protein [Pareuzebyella sediminis]
MSIKDKIRSLKNSLKSDYELVKPKFISYSNDLKKFVTWSFVIWTFTNFIEQKFNFYIVPPIEYTLLIFRDFAHRFLDFFVFSWLNLLMAYIAYGFTTMCSWVFPIYPVLPKVVIPDILKDLAIVSIALTRIFNSADEEVTKEQRIEGEKRTTQAQKSNIFKVEGWLFGSIHWWVQHANKYIWNLVNAIVKKLRFIPYSKKIIKPLIFSIISSITFWGFIRFIGYTINVVLARKLDYPNMIVRKRYFRFYMLFLITAIIATAFFFIANGTIGKYIVESGK